MRGTLDPLVLTAAAVAVLCMSSPRAQGPTRRAFLMEGCGTGLHFQVSLDGAEARALFDQGMMQLHGRDYFEAERSFRQVAALEPNCAMAYWGVAMANVQNPDRAAHFIEEAARRRHHVTPRERRLVDALARFYEARPEPKPERRTGTPADVYEVRKRAFDQNLAVRSQRLLAAWEAILENAPDDIEVMALVVRQVWLNALAGTLTGVALDKEAAKARRYLGRIFKQSPRHPAHFYRLQFDVIGDAQGALQSVGVAGHHAPAVRGHWSSSGRLLANAHRHEDALEYYEAALRVAHTYLARERAMPFVLSGYADDAAGYARCLMRLGRVKAAQDWLEYLADLPRHPRWNRVHDPRSIAGQGQRCSLELSVQYRLGAAPKDIAVADPEVRSLIQADALLGANQPQAAVEVLRKEASARPNRVATMLRLLDALVCAGDKGRAAAQLLRLRKIAGRADLEQPLFAQAHALARELEFPKDWRQPRNRAADWPRDLGPLPHLGGLGPTRWMPPTPHGWVLRNADGNKVSLQDYRGKPLVIVLHLGFG